MGSRYERGMNGEQVTASTRNQRLSVKALLTKSRLQSWLMASGTCSARRVDAPATILN